MIYLPVSVDLQDAVATMTVKISDTERGIIIITGRFGIEVYFSSIIAYGSVWNTKQVVFTGSNTLKNEQTKKTLSITSNTSLSSEYEVNALLIK